jgi:hypothetical protein
MMSEPIANYNKPVKEATLDETTRAKIQKILDEEFGEARYLRLDIYRL